MDNNNMAWSNTFNHIFVKDMQARASKGDARAKYVLNHINQYGLSSYLGLDRGIN